MSFDAILIISFGGPQGPEDVRPFLQNVLRGRAVAPGRLEAVARHYDVFGGVSPITALTQRQADGLARVLAARGAALPVFVGMRNWHPLLPDTLAEMSTLGIRRAIGFISAAQRSYSSCAQYKQNVTDARAELVQRGLPDVEVVYVEDWHAHEGFVGTNARHVAAALEELPAALRDPARIIFTAHSIPAAMSGAERYQLQLRQSAEAVAARLDRDNWALVYQSRSGRPDDPWLGPDIGDYLREEHARGLAAAILSPIGFVCDHIEVLYDLDEEAADICRQLGLPMVRAKAVNDDPAFIDLIGDVVLKTWRRYEHGRPLTLAPPSKPERAEGLPPARGRG